MGKLKKLVCVLFVIFLSLKADGQTFTQTYIDKCSGEIKVATTIMSNGFATVSFYNQVRTFSPTEVQSGAVQIWLNAVYAQYSTKPCPTNQVVQQTVTQAVSQATAQAANTAAAAASNVASSAASSAASSSASSAASSSASSAASSSAASSTPPASGGSSQSSSTSSSNSSSSSGGGSSEQKSETKTETKSEQKSEQKQEQKQEEKKEETKSEEKKEEKKEESKEEQNDEKKEEKKDDKKKGRPVSINPMILSSDMAAIQSPDQRFAMMMSVGISKSSLMGDKSYSATALIWSTLDQYAISGGMTKMDFEEGKLNGIHSYSATFAYLKGTWMAMQGYTYIKPHPKIGTYGFNVGLIHLVMRDMQNIGFDYSLLTSFVAFWTKPYQVNRKTTLAPSIFVMNQPISFNTNTLATAVNRSPGYITGLDYTYKLSRRFGFGASYKAIVNTFPNFQLLHNIQIGSKLAF